MSSILIVDDNEDVCDLLQQVLSTDGYKVSVATNGTDAMSSLQRERPDLVITDIAMPRYSGNELIQDILRKDPTIPVIIHTGYPVYESTFMAWSADACVVKSGDFTELRNTIKRVLSMHMQACPCT